MPTVRNVEFADDVALAAFVKFAKPLVQNGHGTRAAQCDGKQKFSEFKLADIASKRRKKRQVYRCRYCHSYHVGTRA